MYLLFLIVHFPLLLHLKSLIVFFTIPSGFVFDANAFLYRSLHVNSTEFKLRCLSTLNGMYIAKVTLKMPGTPYTFESCYFK